MTEFRKSPIGSLRRGAKSALRVLGDLPVVQDRIEELKPRTRRAVQRKLATFDPEKRRCHLCQHFDPNQKPGQHHRVFLQVMGVLSPAEMASSEKGDWDPDTGKLRHDDPEETQSKLGPSRLDNWDDYGACLRHYHHRNRLDSCEDWS